MGYIINYSGEFTDTTLPTFPLAFSSFSVASPDGIPPVEGGIQAGASFISMGTDSAKWYTENGSAKKGISTPTNSFKLAIVDVGVPDVFVQTSLLVTIVTRSGLAARVKDASNYVAIRSTYDRALEVIKVVAGVGTVIASIEGAYETKHAWGLKVSGSTITIYRDGVVLWTATEQNLPDGTGAGLYSREVSTSCPAWSDLTISRA